MSDTSKRRRAQAADMERTLPLLPGDWNIPQMLRDDADEIEFLIAVVKYYKNERNHYRDKYHELLAEGHCRFNCRTQRETWNAAVKWMQYQNTGEFPPQTPNKGFEEWRKSYSRK